MNLIQRLKSMPSMSMKVGCLIPLKLLQANVYNPHYNPKSITDMLYRRNVDKGFPWLIAFCLKHNKDQTAH